MLAGWEGMRLPLWAVVCAPDAARGLDWLHGGEETRSAHSAGELRRWGHKEKLVWRGELKA